MNQSEEIERLSEELKQSAKECDVVEVHRDEWSAAELAAMTDGFSLGPPRGPNNDFRRLHYDAEADTALELERLKEENERLETNINALFKLLPAEAYDKYIETSFDTDLARHKAEQDVIEAARKQVALTNEMNCFEPVPPIFDLEKAVEALDTIGQEAPNTQGAENANAS